LIQKEKILSGKNAPKRLETMAFEGAVMIYFGPNAKKGLSCLIASVSGAILAGKLKKLRTSWHTE